MSAARIGVGVPVWQGVGFVAETIDCMLSQRDVAVEVFICIDGADRESESACRPFASDPRVRIVVQPQRLGWGENCAAALAGAAAKGAPYVCLQPHDDLVDSDYLRSLVEVAEARPNAAVVYSDIRAFGSYSDLIVQPDVTGTPIERQLALLRCFHAVAFRGLTRAAALSRAPMAGNSYWDFACDIVWLARLARVGDLVRVPRELYRKRYHAANTYKEWHAWSFEQRTEAWLQHCLDMLAEALRVCSRREDVDRVVAAARARLVDDSASPYRADLARLAPEERAHLLRRFDELCVARVRYGPLGRKVGDRLREAWRRVVGLAGMAG